MSTSTFVRYERRGDRVVPVRVTKAWAHTEVRNLDQRKEPKRVDKFHAVRVSEVPWRAVSDRDRSTVHEGQAESWCSSQRVDSRERLLTLLVRGTEDQPVLQEAGYDQRWLPLGDLSRLTWAQANQKLAGEA